MDFFEHQERAKTQTKRLLLLFGMGVAGIVLTLWIAILFIARFQGWFVPPFSAEGAQLLLGVTFITTLAVGGSSAFKTLQLRAGGGHAVARSLRGHPIDPHTTDPLERRLLNVVEEMAIAAQIPPPAVYLLQEKGINAFAAGYRPEEAVIGVTRGCAECLTRDQLQGVIAHEFSHILNGDMNLNTRLIGILFGILVLSYVGWRIMAYGPRTFGRSRRGGDKAALATLLLGLALVVVGALGAFFGNLIKAAVSRRREYLADASAVQFTRNPEGIGGALKAIGAHAQGAKLEAPHAEEASHLLFGGTQRFNSSWLSSHPPLEERIRRILPDWDGDFGPPPSSQQWKVSSSSSSSPKNTFNFSSSSNSASGDS